MYQNVEFHGTEIVWWYWYMLQNIYSDMPWQIRTAYGVVLLSILAIIVLACVFLRKWHIQRNKNKKMQKVQEAYEKRFERIMLGDAAELEKIRPEFEQKKKGDAVYYIPMLTKLRTALDGRANIAMIRELSDIIGIRHYCEDCLLNGHEVFTALQVIVMTHLKIQEGRLAKYLNHKNMEIRCMARICYMWCAKDDPFKFVPAELDGTLTEMEMTLTHYGLESILKETGKTMDFDEIEKMVQSHRGKMYLENERKLLTHA